MAGETKKCEVCDAVIAKDATACPACGTDLEELELTISGIEKAEAVRAKRKAKEQPPEPEKNPEPKRSIFGSLAKKKKDAAKK